MASNNQPASNSKSAGFLSVFLVVAALYFAREVFVPLALAVLMAILLGPLAKWLEKLHLGRVGSVLTAVLIALVVAGGLMELVTSQLREFGKKLPEYEQNIHQKLQKIQAGNGGAFGGLARSFEELRKDLTPPDTQPSVTNVIADKTDKADKADKPAEQKPVPVEVRNPETSPLQFVKKLVGPMLNVLVTLFLVTVFCIFILVGRDDLRARLIRISGSHNVKTINQFIDDTVHRVSRYLLMQLIVNVIYGIPIGLGLWAIGIPNPLLWGMAASLFRYIPYAGPWIAASMPLAVAMAIGSGWGKPAMVLTLFGVMEIFTANLVEPWLYGNSTGITPLAVLLAATFWTWLWGPVGLLLSVPLTVSVVSIGRYVPQLELLEHMFGESSKEKEK